MISSKLLDVEIPAEKSNGRIRKNFLINSRSGPADSDGVNEEDDDDVDAKKERTWKETGVVFEV